MEILENNKVFRQLGFIRQISFNLSMSSIDFKMWFNEHVSNETNLLGFSDHEKAFHGEIKNRTFEISRNASFYNNTIARGQGYYEESNNSLKLDIILFIPIGLFMMFFSVLTVMTIVTINLLLSYGTPTVTSIIIISFLGFFYFWLFWNFKKNVKQLTHSLEKELSSLSQQNAPQQSL
jgi:hypothetical protein